MKPPRIRWQYCFLTQRTLRSWRWRKYIRSKHWWTPSDYTALHPRRYFVVISLRSCEQNSGIQHTVWCTGSRLTFRRNISPPFLLRLLYWFLARLSLQTWRWRQKFSPKRRPTVTEHTQLCSRRQTLHRTSYNIYWYILDGKMPDVFLKVNMFVTSQWNGFPSVVYM
jgi:hypothetical protein